MSETYEAIPIRLAIPLAPKPSIDTLDTELEAASRAHGAKNISMVGAKSFDDNIEDARTRTDELLRQCRNQVADGKSWALLDLLNLHPELAADAWVQKTLVTLINESKLKKRRGRPFSSYKIHQLIVVGIVNELVASGEDSSPEKAFYHLKGCEFLSYHEAKRRYYAALRDERFKFILMQFPERTRSISAAEMERELGDVETFESGQTIDHTGEDPELGPFTMTIAATDEPIQDSRDTKPACEYIALTKLGLIDNS